MAAINPYLHFPGNTEEAFNFYRSVFGGEFQSVMRYKDMPAEIPQSGNVNAERIMHISLPIGNGTALHGSDRPEYFGPMAVGDNFHVVISGSDEAEAKRLFDGLAEGGKITMPLEKAFWGALFGMCIDKYGIQWMINYDASQL
jgi:PhnB protein